jgi:hypothetical protein
MRTKISDRAIGDGFIIFSLIWHLLSSAGAYAAELASWRADYYKIAHAGGHLHCSPSGMFWDDIQSDTVFAPLWQYPVNDSDNFWKLEPSLSAATFWGDKEIFRWNGRLTSDIRYNRFFIRNSITVDPGFRDDPLYPYKQDRVSAGYWEEAYFQFRHPIGFLRLGRLKRNWGPFIDRSLIVSSHPFSYDALEWQLKSSFFEFRHLIGSFPYASSWRDAQSYPERDAQNLHPKRQRWLLAHSLNFMIGKWVTLGVTESFIASVKHGIPDLQTLNPFTSYTIMTTNEEYNGNAILGLQWRILPFTERIALLGQVIIDDIQVDNKSLGDQEPSHWGLDCAIHWRNPLPIPAIDHGLVCEYAYASKWLYLVTWNNTREGQRYTYHQKSIGYPFNDGDRAHVMLFMRGKKWWQASLGAYYMRKGGNTLTTPWNTGGSYNGYRKETSLRADTTQHGIAQYFEGLFYVAPYAELKLGITNEWIKSSGNARNDWAYAPRIALTLSGHYPRFFIRF